MKIVKLTIPVFLLVMLSSPYLYAQIYHFIDKNGVHHVSNCPVDEGYRKGNIYHSSQDTQRPSNFEHKTKSFQNKMIETITDVANKSKPTIGDLRKAEIAADALNAMTGTQTVRPRMQREQSPPVIIDNSPKPPFNPPLGALINPFSGEAYLPPGPKYPSSSTRFILNSEGIPIGQQIGQQIFYNNLTSGQQIGNQIFNSNGTSGLVIGNQLFPLVGR